MRLVESMADTVQCVWSVELTGMGSSWTAARLERAGE
jgi:hypothetical protein